MRHLPARVNSPVAVRAGAATAMALAGVLSTSCSPAPRATAERPGAAPTSPAVRTKDSPRPAPAAGGLVVGGPAARGLLRPAGGGDGDWWKDTSGREYRLGLVNTPEYNACYGPQATAVRKRLVAGGFRAQVYTSDRYGRFVAVVTTADGTNLNVWLARNGYADDRYLAQFRHENPGLGAELDPAFALAKREHRGLWGAC